MCSKKSKKITKDIADLLGSIKQKSYSLIHEELSRRAEPFSRESAFRLLVEALRHDLRLETFEAILQKSPPVPEILAPDNVEGYTFFKHSRQHTGQLNSLGLVEGAAYMDRDDVLSMLLERGAGPNRTLRIKCQPLDAALLGESRKCLELLTQHPELEISWSRTLLLMWALPETIPAGPVEVLSEARRLCLRSVVPKFAGWPPPVQPPPIPEEMRAEIIAEARNWPLLERFCRERGSVSADDAKKAVRTFEWVYNDLPRLSQAEQGAIAAAMSALFEGCPELLRNERFCRVLLRWYLGSGETGRELLRPWVESLGGRTVAMDENDWERWGWEKFPDYWKQAMPDGPVLVVDRENFILGRIMSREPDPHLTEAFRKILTACPVRGKGKKGELSFWAKEVLRCGDGALIDSLFQQPDGLLATEDPDELIRYVQRPFCPRVCRAAVLAHVRRKVDYEL